MIIRNTRPLDQSCVISGEGWLLEFIIEPGQHISFVLTDAETPAEKAAKSAGSVEFGNLDVMAESMKQREATWDFRDAAERSALGDRIAQGLADHIREKSAGSPQVAENASGDLWEWRCVSKRGSPLEAHHADSTRAFLTPSAAADDHQRRHPNHMRPYILVIQPFDVALAGGVPSSAEKVKPFSSAAVFNPDVAIAREHEERFGRFSQAGKIARDALELYSGAWLDALRKIAAL